MGSETVSVAGVDAKLARGLARYFGHTVDKADGELELMFKSLLSDIFPHTPWRGRDSGHPTTRRLKSDDFNRGRLRFAARAEEAATALCVDSSPMGPRQGGIVSWVGVSRGEIDVAWRGGSSSYEQWVFDLNRIDASERRMSGRFWMAPVVVDHHIIERIFLRTDNTDQVALRRVLGYAAVAASAIADAALLASDSLRPGVVPSVAALPETDVVVPLPIGGALVGGFCLSNAKVFRRSCVHQFTKNGYDVARCRPRHDGPQVVLHLKTYMNDQIIDPEQRVAVAALADYMAKADGLLRIVEPALAACPIPDTGFFSKDAADWFAGLAGAHTAAASTFGHWCHRTKDAKWVA
jgi:hypothetical protein